jgi:hypothetical protein
VASPFQSVRGIIRENAFQHKELESMPNSMEIPWNSHGSKNEFIMSKNSTNGEKCNVFIGFSEDLYSVKSCRNFIINATNSELFIHELK